MSYEGASNFVVVILAGVLVVVALLTGVSLGFLCARRGASPPPLLPTTTMTKKRRGRADWSSADPTMLEILDSLHSLRDTFDRHQQAQQQQQQRWAPAVSSSSRLRASVRRHSEDDETSSEEEETDWERQPQRHSGQYHQQQQHHGSDEDERGRRRAHPMATTKTVSRHAPSSSFLGSRVQLPTPSVPQRRVMVNGLNGRNNGSAARRSRLPV